GAFTVYGFELVDHLVYRVLHPFPPRRSSDLDLLAEVAVGHGSRDVGDVAHLARQVGGHEVDVVGEVLPGAAHASDVGLAAELAFGADFAGHPRDLAGSGARRVGHHCAGVLALEDLPVALTCDLLAEVAVRDRGRDLGDVSHLARQVAGHQVHVVGEVLPGAAYALHRGLAAELAFGAHFAGHPRDLAGEGGELVDHYEVCVFQLHDLALAFFPALRASDLVRDRGRDLGDVSDLGGEVAGHQVHVVGEVFPDTADALHLRLAAELAFGADLAGDSCHLAGEA